MRAGGHGFDPHMMYAIVAQLVEHGSYEAGVVGSSPTYRTFFKLVKTYQLKGKANGYSS